MTEDARSILSRIDLRAIHLSPAGRHTRYMLAGYLRHVFMVTSVLLAIALTIDLWPQLHLITDSQGHSVPIAIWRVLRFSVLRTPNLVAPFLPFATFLGVVWTEVAHTRAGERMLVWNSGRSPIQCLTPAILLGIILGAVEFTMDAHLGPAAMAVQMQERLGLDGQRLDRTRREDSHWITTSGGLLSTEIEYGPPPVLHHPTFYQLDARGQLTEVNIATVARQLPGTNLWLMHDGRVWSSQGEPTTDGAADPTLTLGNSPGETMVPFAERTVQLEIDPLWLSVFGMEPQYLSMPVLRALAQLDSGPPSKGPYRTRLQVLYGEALLPGAMALLAASLSFLLLAYSTRPRALVGILFTGYLAHFATKACLLMGQNGYMSPIMAGWLVPAALFGVTLAAFRVIGLRRIGVGG
jgi:lipopolysaccharide export LptBFGC system permease protein LptF